MEVTQVERLRGIEEETGGEDTYGDGRTGGEDIAGLEKGTIEEEFGERGEGRRIWCRKRNWV